MASRLRAQFQSDELAAVMARYELGAIHRIDQQLKGSRRSPKVIIVTDRGRFLLKRRAKGRDLPLKVALSHAIQQYLAARGFPLPKLVSVRGGDDTMVILDEQIYEMFEFVGGEHYDRSAAATRDAGRVLGLFHKLLQSYQPEWEPSRRGYHDVPIVRNHLNEIPASIGKNDSVVGKETELLATVSMLYELYESAAEKVNEAGYHTWPTQIVHADWHPGNMLFHAGKVVAVIDYDSLHLLPAATDVANGALQFSIIGGTSDPREWPAELDEERLRRFFAGYEKQREVPEDAVPVLPWLMIESLIAEAVMPIAATGSFGRLEGFRFLQMILRKARWLDQNADRLMVLVHV